jgi:uncharacterized protein YegP (UPF0339 family)
MKYLITVQKGKSRWFWNLKHRNGHILAHSEQYSSRFKARQTAKTLAAAFKRGLCQLDLG